MLQFEKNKCCNIDFVHVVKPHFKCLLNLLKEGFGLITIRIRKKKICYPLHDMKYKFAFVIILAAQCETDSKEG